MAERRCLDSRAGFTLVELLVSMAVLALVAVTMMAGLRFVIRAFEHTDSRRAARASVPRRGRKGLA